MQNTLDKKKGRLLNWYLFSLDRYRHVLWPDNRSIGPRRHSFGYFCDIPNELFSHSNINNCKPARLSNLEAKKGAMKNLAAVD